jgi:hypothetical protein
MDGWVFCVERRGGGTNIVKGEVIRITPGEIKILPIKLKLIPLGRDETTTRCRGPSEEGEWEESRE